MTAVAEPRPQEGRARPAGDDSDPPPPHEHRADGGGASEVVRLLAVLALLLTTLAPLSRIFADSSWLRPIAGGVLVAVGICWGVRQLGAGGLVIHIASLAGWAVFTSAVLAPTTTRFGLLPTRETLDVGAVLLADAAERIRLESAPVDPDAALLLVAITGTWAVATIVCDAMFHRRLPLAGIAVALVGLSVPIPLADRTSGLLFAVPFLAAAAGVLLAFGASAVRRWPTLASRGAMPSRPPSAVAGGVALAALAIGAGALLAESLPGFGDPPLYEVRGRGGAPTTDNPMVDLRTRLTAEDTGPVLEVTTERPVYLRTTALDTYADQSWTSESIRGTPIGAGGAISPEVRATSTEEVTVDVEVADLRGELVPAPYPPVAVDGPLAEQFQHDGSNGTIILDGGEQIGDGDEYTVTAALPDPDAARVGATEGFAPDGALTELPDSVPDRVVDLAEGIVADAGATTPLQQALAIQAELQSWNYSLEPPQGHGATALESFLDTQTGYCEQFAATMAIMLRTLDIPARVAVGFTPGTLVDPDEGRWEISNDNAHAWVEVLFPETGWLSFEPTPRTDGNILLPSAANLVPDDTAAGDSDPADLPDPADDDLMFPDLDDEAPFPEDGLEQGAAGNGGSTSEDDRTWPWVAAGAALAAAALALLVAAVRRAPASSSAVARIRRARSRAERLGRALGVPVARSDTDREFLTRLASTTQDPIAADAAGRLATEAARARYAPEVPAEAADRAEMAVATLAERLPAADGLAERGRRALRLARGHLPARKGR